MTSRLKRHSDLHTKFTTRNASSEAFRVGLTCLENMSTTSRGSDRASQEPNLKILSFLLGTTPQRPSAKTKREEKKKRVGGCVSTILCPQVRPRGN